MAKEIARELRLRDACVVLLDGDELRQIFAVSDEASQTYDRESRLKLARRYGLLCENLARQGVTVVIATISLFREVHEWNRLNLQDYFQAYLKVPETVLRERDSKGIYRKFDAGEVVNVAGLDLTIDEPEEPDWAPEFDPSRSVVSLANTLIELLTEKKLI